MYVVDKVNMIYKTMFSIKFEHNSYNQSGRKMLSDVLKVKPDADTIDIFSQHKILYRFDINILTCLVSCEIINIPGDEPKSKPVIRFADDTMRMRFLVNASTEFLKNTNIIAAGAKEVYLFSNKINAGVNMVITADENGVTDAGDLKPVYEIKPGNPCLAVIDIHTHVPDNDYKIFDDHFMLVDNMPEYKIIFKQPM